MALPTSKHLYFILKLILLIGLALPVYVVVEGAEIDRPILREAIEQWRKDEAQKQGYYKKEFQKLKPLAKQGNANSQVKLGIMYKHGRGVKQNYSEALRLFKLSAEQGNAEAMLKIGSIYKFGMGVAKDEKEAVRWFQLAAERGFLEAQGQLGWMFEKGTGIKRNLVQAYKWYYISLIGGRDSTTSLNIVGAVMTPAERTEAKRLAKEWMEKHR